MPGDPEIGADCEALIERLLASGRYASRSEVLRAGLRLLQEHEADMERRRAAIFASIDEAIRDIEENGGYSAEEVLAYMDHIIEQEEKRRDAAE